LILSWDEESRTFQVHRDDGLSAHAGVAARLMGDGQSVGAREFLRFALETEALLDEEERTQTGGSALASSSSPPMLDLSRIDLVEKPVARLRIEGATQIKTAGFPVVFENTGLSSGGSILVSIGSARVEELRIPEAAVAAEWTRS
jgi:hypothetical protein